LTQFVLQLGPFGGAFIGGWQVRVWAVAYLGLVAAIALFGFHRKDL
jgi:predicted MFS family arabinose efflux permease